MIDPKEAARIVERVMTEWGKQDSLRDMLDEITAALLAAKGSVLVDATFDIDRTRREGWAQGMIDTLRTIQSVGKVPAETLRAALHILIEENDQIVRYGDSDAKRAADAEDDAAESKLASTERPEGTSKSSDPAVRDVTLREALEAWRAFDNEPRSFHSHRDLELLARARDLTHAVLSSTPPVRDTPLREALEKIVDHTGMVGSERIDVLQVALTEINVCARAALSRPLPSAALEKATLAVRDEVGSQLCRWTSIGKRVCEAVPEGVCLCRDAASAALSHPSLPDGEGNQ